MTGYNHYPGCACGWCVNYGRTRISRAEIRTSLRVHDAETFLKKNGARFNRRLLRQSERSLSGLQRACVLLRQ